MINAESRTLDWIVRAGKENNIHDLTLLEKTIRAFSLLEALARSGCPFYFKGGSALMLHPVRVQVPWCRVPDGR